MTLPCTLQLGVAAAAGAQQQRLPQQAPAAAARAQLQQREQRRLRRRGAQQAATASGDRAAAASAAAPAAALRGADFLRPHLRRMAPYTPIEPFEVLSERLGRAPQDIIKLDANENPYGPPPEVRQALATLQFPHIYPDPESRRLRAALAADCGVPPEYILAGCGADELIDILMRCVLEPGDAILNCPPTFGMYAFDADVNDARVVDVPRRADFSVDVPAVLAAAAEHAPKVLFLTSPNNPDGCVLSDADLSAVLAALPRCLVVLDEAYVEFSGAASRMPWVARHENLVVLRTFSKRAGLAGMRIGYGAFPLSMMEFLWRAKQPYNVSVAAEVAALAALSNQAYLTDVRDKLVAERERLAAMLARMPGLRPFPSAANFVLCAVDGHDAAALKERLMREEGIMVRYYSKPAALAGCIRVSVGTPAQTDKLETALKRLLAK